MNQLRHLLWTLIFVLFITLKRIIEWREFQTRFFRVITSSQLVKLLITTHVVINFINQQSHHSLILILNHIIIAFICYFLNSCSKLFLAHSNSVTPRGFRVIVKDFFAVIGWHIELWNVTEFSEIVINNHTFPFICVRKKLKNRTPNLKS